MVSRGLPWSPVSQWFPVVIPRMTALPYPESAARDLAWSLGPMVSSLPAVPLRVAALPDPESVARGLPWSPTVYLGLPSPCDPPWSSCGWDAEVVIS
jgi:hypothetical protein